MAGAACAIRPATAPRTGGFRLPSLTAPESVKALVGEPTRASPRGVSDGARTRDTQDHNLVLYQLSYTHRRSPARRTRREGNRSNDTGAGQLPDAAGGATSSSTPTRGVASPAARTSANASTTSSAAPFTWSLLGPGAGTNSVRR